ncbi:MAG: sulfatase-like hydrolase/transferase [Aureispira sp.]
MKRQSIICTILLYCCVQTLTWAQAPNIVFIFVDDQGWNGTSHSMDSSRSDAQSDYYRTPVVANLAQQGMTFSQAYAPAPKCSPSRSSILTGQTTAKRQFTNTTSAVNPSKFLLEPSSNTSLPITTTTFAEVVQNNNNNYWLAHYGKWHLGTGGPEAHGFDRSDGNTSNLSSQGSTTQADPKLMFEITDSALTFIKDAQTAGRPFFVQLSHYAVHTPQELQASTLQYLRNPNRPIGVTHRDTAFGGMTEDLDVSIGMLLDSLTNWGLDNNTYVVYMSDNGASAGISRNTPLSRGKLFLKEGGIRVPLLIRGPNIPANTYNTVPVIGYDLYPTFVEWMLGSTLSVPADVEGQSITPLATGNSSFTRTEALFFHSPHYDQSPNKRPESAIRNDSFKLMVDYELGDFFLYDMRQDIEENTDLKVSLPNIERSLRIELRDYLKRVNAAMPSLNPNFVGNTGPVGDYDNDGLNDAWEFRELLTHSYIATDDPDGDGLDNAWELANGTDPYTPTVVSVDNIQQNATNVQVFPNPTNSNIHVTSEQPFDQVLLYNYTGQTLLKKSKKSGFSIAHLPAGVYFLTIKNKGAIIHSQELVITKK